MLALKKLNVYSYKNDKLRIKNKQRDNKFNINSRIIT